MTESEEQLLNALQNDLSIYRDLIRETAHDMVQEGYTSYPIFVAHHIPLPLGELILNKADYGTSFSISASTLEEFGEKGLVQPANMNRFKQTYKDPMGFMCIFLISETGGRFVFRPYEDEPKIDPKLN
ncbi:MAG: hypothetical protein H6606_01980 [Flavobacteriales bacterium]|nr:hypothetical protein [Flavobacteriales bacterium]